MASRARQPCWTTRSGDGSTCGRIPQTVTYTCHATTSSATTTTAGSTRRSSGDVPGAVVRRLGSGLSEVLIGEVRRPVGFRGQRCPVGASEQAVLEQETGVPRPLLGRLCPDLS